MKNNGKRIGRGTPPRRNARRNGRALSTIAVSGTPAAIQRLPGLGFPDSMICNHRYADNYPLVCTSGILATQKMRWNSTFDPDFTGTGHQPLYRDTLASIYDHYSVISAYIEVQVVNTGTVPMLCGIVTDDDTSTSATVGVLMEQAYGQHQLLPAQAGSLSSCTFRMDWDCKKVLKIDPYTSETYKTANSSNPTEESILQVWAIPIDASTTATAYASVTLVQNVLWTELATPTLS